MSCRFAVIVTLVGCGFHVNGATGTDGPLPMPDAAIDAPVVHVDAMIDAAIDAPGSDGSGSGSDGSGSGSGGSGSGSGSGSAVSCWSRWADSSIGSAFGSAVPIAAASVAGRNERDPFLTTDELSLYFADEGSGFPLVATRSSLGSDFGSATPFDAANPDGSNGTSKVSISADGTTMIVQRSSGGGSLWMATGSGGSGWSALSTTHLMGINNSGTVYDPELGSNGLSFIYAPTSGGTQHLEIATRPDTSASFSTAAIPGFSTSPPSSQADPWLDATGTLLVFSQSDSGDTNIYYALANGSGTFGAPTAIPSVNTGAAEGDPWVSPDGCRIYFSSTRGSGAYHVWVGSAAPE